MVSTGSTTASAGSTDEGARPTLLIANRGEIALRVMRSARRLGWRTVAIHSDLDRSAAHVRAADVAVRVESYLDVDAVVAAAVATGAGYVHPGYGFLSERAEFARAVETAGLKLVGPSSVVMDRMGRKDAAREIAIEAGVPVVPNFSVAEGGSLPESSYPVLVKAAAGGGGKGMRIVRTAAEYDAAVAAARREASSAFGDDTMLIEKYVEHGRHVEVQVLADGHGNVVHLYERDCSTQRRHQKVLEEAPAPTITAAQRELVTSAAVALTSQVGYESAGTVEFLLDVASGEAYFLEMNTRLQVEHPVTELVVAVGSDGAALDLVDLQLRIAAGAVLPFAQDDLWLRGHAIEARVYAEDSFNGFLPQAGTTSIVRWVGGSFVPEPYDSAAAGQGVGSAVRVDAALEGGQVVSTSYDPMLGKVIAYGPDRESARRTLVAALDETAILGLTTNTGFLRALLASPEFRDATIDTAWLDTASVPEPSAELPRLIAAWTQGTVAALTTTPGPFAPDGWRQGAEPAPLIVELDRPVRVDRQAGTVDGTPVRELLAENHTIRLDVDGERHQAVVNVDTHLIDVMYQGQRFVFERPDVFGDHGPAAGDGTLLAPMPGTVLTVEVEVGQSVQEGATLGAMEAMKMELALKAPFAGTVTQVNAKAGDQVPIGTTLFVVEAE